MPKGSKRRGLVPEIRKGTRKDEEGFRRHDRRPDRDAGDAMISVPRPRQISSSPDNSCFLLLRQCRWGQVGRANIIFLAYLGREISAA